MPEAVVRETDIVEGLRRLGLRAGMGVMVHSSLRSFGRVEGGARSVLNALMEVITPEGTLMLPSFNHGAPFEEGGPGYFDPCQTPTTNGAIPDLFWRLPGVTRSWNPTHAFAAWGRCSQRYTQHHHRTLTMGHQSPLGLLNAEGGYGLLLGVGYGSNTFHHVVEMSTGAPCLGQRSESYPMILPGGRSVEGRTWGWRERSCPFTDGERYQDEMEARGLQRVTMIGGCRATLFKLSDCYEVVANILRGGKAGFPPCAACPVRPRRAAQTVASDWDPNTQGLLPGSSALDY